jgi:hypothetical protein
LVSRYRTTQALGYEREPKEIRRLLISGQTDLHSMGVESPDPYQFRDEEEVEDRDIDQGEEYEDCVRPDLTTTEKTDDDGEDDETDQAEQDNER